MKKRQIEFQSDVLNHIAGDIQLDQADHKKNEIIREAVRDVCRVHQQNQGERQKPSYCADDKLQEQVRRVKSYGLLEQLLDDPDIEDIIINGSGPVHAHIKGKGLQSLPCRIKDRAELDLLIKKLLVFGGKRSLDIINNVDLPGMRGRVNIVRSPQGPEVTITKIKSRPFSIIDLLENQTLTDRMAALLWFYVEGMGIKPANILVSGGPGAGKTTFLNALLEFIPADQHMVIVEDSLELRSEWIADVSRVEAEEDCSLKDLVKNSLRMRPDRIIVGEVRGEEARDMMTAMNIGKFCMGTVHAGTAKETIQRMESHPMNVPASALNLIDIIVVLGRVSAEASARRVVTELAETSNMETGRIALSPLWRFRNASAGFEELGPTVIFRDKLSRQSGIENTEILNEIEQRRLFLNDLRKNQVRDIKEVYHACQGYLRRI
ncbi:MAG: ATPase, T2SS/T4P/T4SS family [Candidatus Omnitrophota bacterium]